MSYVWYCFFHSTINTFQSQIYHIMLIFVLIQKKKVVIAWTQTTFSKNFFNFFQAFIRLNIHSVSLRVFNYFILNCSVIETFSRIYPALQANIFYA